MTAGEYILAVIKKHRVAIMAPFVLFLVFPLTGAMIIPLFFGAAIGYYFITKDKTEQENPSAPTQENPYKTTFK